MNTNVNSLSGVSFRQYNPNRAIKNKQSQTNFTGNGCPSPNPRIDSFLKNKTTQKVLRLASLNPFAFCVGMAAFIGIAIRPISILMVPGANKKDKQYAAWKSAITSIFASSAKIAICLPVAKSIVSLGNKALKGEVKDFPKLKTPKFNALNYLVNNGLSLCLMPFTTLAIAYTLPKIMKRILPNKKQVSTIDSTKQNVGQEASK